MERISVKWSRKRLRRYQRQGLTLSDAIEATLRDAMKQAGISAEELQRVLEQQGSQT